MSIGAVSRGMVMARSLEAGAGEIGIEAAPPVLEPIAEPKRSVGTRLRELAGAVVSTDTSVIATAGTLTELAAAATVSEYSGITNDMAELPHLIAGSSAHPVLGYSGAWAANVMFRNAPDRVRRTAMFAGATIANFVTETAQSLLVASPEYVNYMSSRNLPETAKDYAFSLLGAGLFAWQARKAAKKG